MKKMKSLLCIVLSFVLAFALSSPINTFADDPVATTVEGIRHYFITGESYPTQIIFSGYNSRDDDMYLNMVFSTNKVVDAGKTATFHYYVEVFDGAGAKIGGIGSELTPDKDHYLGITYNLFDKASYSHNIASKLKKNRWQDVYLYYDSGKKAIYIYNGESLATKIEYKAFTSPLQEVWLGSIWIGGGENYGPPINILYDEISISNRGILPKPSFIQYIINRIMGL